MQHNHICGLYFIQGYERIYLPQVELKSHTILNRVCFTTKLTQRYDNPKSATLAQVRFTFPLYDGIAVNGYSISYADKNLRGIVQQEGQAKKTYQAALDRGETAGLLESLPAGVFGVTLGNVPAQTAITVEITYCGELKHDAGIDGIRYSLPTSIAPRYGNYPGKVLISNASAGGTAITVDVDMASSPVRRVQSPSHPIAVSMGALSSTVGGDNAPFAPSQASATLTSGRSELADDFILQVLVGDIDRPQAILETHPSLQDQRALMTTVVPKFALEPARPEIVFIADQSGSMSGLKNASLVKALKVFIKSLPFGVRFNICAFGSDFKFLFPKSQAYNECNLNTALTFVESFAARYGGTKVLEPITAAFKQHLSDMPLEVMLLTDGEIWGEDAVFDCINEQIAENKLDARVFALGIGGDVSHTLVEGVARAGNGFAQFVTKDEETDQKVMRMLRAALYPHTKDYRIEIHYNDEDAEKMGDDDDFEIVEKVNDCLKIAEQPASAKSNTTKPKSFFDASASLDEPANIDGPPARYAHLPTIETPKLLQVPNTIPPLFPFNRTTLYLLLGPESPQKTVASVTLRAKSAQGPLELTIPVHNAAATGVATIHQLAARNATQDLEQGRGWLQSATIGDSPVKAKFEGRFDELVERECLRLGEKFQVVGKWTSFVAVEANGEKTEDLPEAPARLTRGGTGGGHNRFSCCMSTGNHRPLMQQASMTARRYVEAPSTHSGTRFSMGTGLFGSAGTLRQRDRRCGTVRGDGPLGGTMSMAQASPLTTSHRNVPSGLPPPSALTQEEEKEESEGSDEDMGFTLSDESHSESPAPRFLVDASEEDGASEDEFPKAQAPALAAFPVSPAGQAVHARFAKEMESAAEMPIPDDVDSEMAEPISKDARRMKTTSAMDAEEARKMSSLIDLQKFSGAWGWSDQLLSLLAVDEEGVKAALGGYSNETAMATALAVAFLEKRVGGKKEVWEMVVGKARAFLRNALSGGGERVEEVVGKAKGLL